MKCQTRRYLGAAAAATVLAVTQWTLGEVRGQGFTSYGKAYQQTMRSNPNTMLDTDRYLYNRYFRNNPAVSPYVSGALLGGGEYGTGYTSVTRPDVARRQANDIAQARYVQQRKMQGNVGHTAYPGSAFMGGTPGMSYQKPVPSGARSSGAYQNHWYGAWNR